MKEAIIKYITPRIEKRKEILEKEILEKKTKESVGLILSVIVNLSSGAVAILNPTIGGAIAIISMGVYCLKFRNCLELTKRENRIIKEIENLNKLKKDFNNSIEEKNIKIVQLRRTEEMNKEAAVQYKKARNLTNTFVGIASLGAVGILINPYLGIISLPGIVLSAIAVKQEIKKYDIYQLVKESATELNHYIEFSNVINRNTTKKASIEMKKVDKKDEVKEIEQLSEKDTKRIEDIFNQIYYCEEEPEKSIQYRKEK